MSLTLEALVSDARKALFFRDFEQALTLLNRACEMAVREARGDDVIAPLLRAIADARCGLNDLDGAETYYREALGRMEQSGAGEGEAASGLLSNLGYVLDKLERFEESEEVHKRALVLRTRLLGKDHPGLVPSLNNLAYGYMKRGDHARADALLERALTLMQAAVGEDHLALAEPLNNLGELRRRAGDLQRAAPHLQRALAIMQANVPYENHPDLLPFLENNAALARAQGRDADALELERRIEVIRAAT